ncbi:MAG TPA: hypothetical protein VGZ50_08555 [Actinomycetota bacterium]|nr:hypothetical protein [Actinomycetota bacterium]
MRVMFLKQMTRRALAGAAANVAVSSGPDTFTYTITDGNAGTAMATVTVQVRKASGCSG